MKQLDVSHRATVRDPRNELPTRNSEGPIYPEIIEDAVAATVLTLLPKKVSVAAVKGSRCMTVKSYSGLPPLR